MNYGMPYKGSKNRIAEKIISFLPPAEHFYDCFGGGGAITHCALLSGKYRYVHYNELDPLVFKGFKMAVNGEFKNENRWISREEFHKLKDTDPYVAFCFSFGNCYRTYAYNPEIEKFKKAVHYLLFFNDDSLIKNYIDFDYKFKSDSLKEKRLELQRYLKDFIHQIKGLCNTDNNNVGNVCQNLERLERLQNLELKENLILSDKSYNELKFEENSVIYCDPPYIDSEQYRTKFNHEDFYNWARNQKNIFISEYRMPDDFKEAFSIKKSCTFKHSGKSTIEKIFTNSSTSLFDEW